jgi:hypothetical protein
LKIDHEETKKTKKGWRAKNNATICVSLPHRRGAENAEEPQREEEKFFCSSPNPFRVLRASAVRKALHFSRFQIFAALVPSRLICNLFSCLTQCDMNDSFENTSPVPDDGFEGMDRPSSFMGR